MRRHELDLTSLVTGLVFLAIAAAYLVAEFTDRDISAGWVLPLGLIGLGLAGLTGSLRRGLRSDAAPVTQPPAAVDDAEHPAEDPGLS